MIAIDTNVLLRYLLDDDPVQSQKAKQSVERRDKTLLTDVVLAETVWTLGAKKYQFGKPDIIRVITALLEDARFYFEDNQAVWQALQSYRVAKAIDGKQAGFNDAFIAAKARHTAQKSGVELAGIFTFDIAAQQLPGLVSID